MAEIEDLWRSFAKGCRDAFVVRERGTEFGWHWHSYIEHKQTITSLRVTVKRHFKLTNADCKHKRYSLEKFDDRQDAGGKYFNYLCKGESSAKDDPVNVVVDLMGRDVASFHRRFYEERLRILEEKAAAKKKRHETLSDKFFEYCKTYRETVRDKETVTSALSEFLRDHARGPDRMNVDAYMCRRWCYRVLLYVCSSGTAMEIARQVRDML